MDDAAFVGHLERLGDLVRDLHGLVCRQRTAIDTLGQVLAHDQFHGEE